MIKEFQYYIKEELVRKIYPNKEEAASLARRASERILYIKKQKIDDFSATFIFEDIYEAIREAAQALMEMKGFKPYSHEAIISFLLEYFKNIPKNDISTFDRYRILRNKVMYKASKVSVETCKEALKFSENFLPLLKKELEAFK